MSVCVQTLADNTLVLDTVSTVCTYSVLTTAEINSLNGLNGLFSQYFDFDPSLFSLIVGGSLLAFATGHILGRIMGLWRKGF